MAKICIAGRAGGFGPHKALALLTKGHAAAGSMRRRNRLSAAVVASLESADARRECLMGALA